MPYDDTLFLKSKVDILSFFNEEQLRKVTPDIERNVYAKGDYVLLKGEVANGFYIVKQGRVAVLLKPKEKPEQVQELAAGEFFGEISLLEDTAATASVKAAEDGTEVIVIPHSSFQKLLEMQPLLKKALGEKAASRKPKA